MLEHPLQLLMPRLAASVAPSPLTRDYDNNYILLSFHRFTVVICFRRRKSSTMAFMDIINHLICGNHKVSITGVNKFTTQAVKLEKCIS